MAKTATQWTLDPAHSNVQFKIKHLVISSVTGSFNVFQGSMDSKGSTFEHAKVAFSLAVDSIDTKNDLRDGHLKSPQFLDVETFPAISFASTAFTKGSGATYQLTGNLTIKDVTKPVTLAVVYGGLALDADGNRTAGFEVSGKVNRKDFGLTWGALTEAASLVLSDDVKLFCTVQLSKQA